MDDKGSGNGRIGIQVIARAAAILRVLRGNTSGMSLGQIADGVDLPRSTVQRIVGALQAEGLVIGSGGSGRIRLGPEITALSQAARYSVVEACRLPLSELSRRVGETADLSVLQGTGMVFLDQIAGIHRLRTVSFVGEVFPLSTTANGRAVLAIMSEEKARRLVEDEWQRLGIAGHWSDLAAGLAATRETGLAYDLDEHTVGISAVGTGFVDLTGDLHSISVPVPSSRFAEARPSIEEALRDARAQIVQAVGGPG